MDKLVKIWSPRDKHHNYKWRTVVACYTDKGTTNIHYSCHDTANNNKRERDATKCGDHHAKLDLPCKCENGSVFLLGSNVHITSGICITSP
jgi:hypothetical protein